MTKRQFGLVKVRFKGLAKNIDHLLTLFALSNLWIARRRLLALTGEVPTWLGNEPKTTREAREKPAIRAIYPIETIAAPFTPLPSQHLGGYWDVP